MFLSFFKSRKIHKLITALALTTGWLHAAPYGPDGMPIEWTQPDGTKLSLRVFGDEFYARTETLDGYTVVFDPATKTYNYATLSADGNEFESTGKAAGKADPKALGLRNRIEIKPEARAAKARSKFEEFDAVVKQRERWEALKQAKRNYETFKKEIKKQEKAGKKGLVIPMGTIFPDSDIPVTPDMAAPAEGDGTGTAEPPPAPAPPSFTLSGDVVGLTILIDFYDLPGTVVTQTQVDDYMNKPGYTGFSNAGSVFDYFYIQSGGKLRYNNNVTYYVRVPKSRAYYNDTTKSSGSCGRLILNDALDILIANGYDFSQLTTKLASGQNRVRACNVFFAGADSGVWAFGLWPHRSALNSPKSVGGGKYIYDYQITNIGTTASLRIGTFCHENGHMLLGYPDLYSYDGSAANMGNYSLMAGGNYGGSPAGTHPVNIDPYLKEASGWMNVIDLNSSSNQRCTVQVDGNQVYRYNNPAKTTEYFMFEVRDNTGYEGPYGGQTGSVNPGTGLVAYHVYETGSNTYSSIFTASNPNCSYTSPYELMVVEANQTTMYTPWYDYPTPDASDAFKASGKSSISDSTTPDLKFWVATSTNGGRLTNSGCNISSISADSNVMTFVAGSGSLGSTPSIVLSSSTLYAHCNYGSNAASESFTIGNGQEGTLNYSISTDQTWVSCTPASGSVSTGSNLINVNFATSALASGTHTATITVTDPAASPTTKTIAVTLVVTNQPYLSASPALISASGYAGMAGPQASFLVRNTGGGTMNYSASEPVSWISLSPTSGSAVAETDTVYVNFDATSLAVGTYNTTITVTSPNASNTQVEIPVNFTVGPMNMVVTSPNGWENWLIGTSKTITWNSILGGNVKIDLLKGGALHSTIIASTPNDGSYSWPVPGSLTPALDYKIRITSVESPGETDQSDLNFVISPDLPTALDTSGITWSTTGNALWFGQMVTTYDGVDAAECGNIGNNQSTSLQATIDGPSTLTFRWKISSESGFDFLSFYLDNVEQSGITAISGTVSWTQKTITIPSGSHTIKWTYSKNGSVTDGSDTAWVDQVVLTPAGAPEIAVEQPVSTSLTDGSSTINFGSVNTGSPSSPFTFTIRNTGTADLTGLAVSKTGTHSADYTVGALGATTLAPGVSTTFSVTFTPGAAGTRTAALQIASNDSDENPFDINLTGTGLGPGTLDVAGTGGLNFSGSYGGPFSPATLSYTLSNPGITSIDWTASKTAAWLDLSNTGGTLAPGDVATLMVSINSSADSLALGNYSDAVTFTNTTNGNGNTTRGVSLAVNPIPATVTLGNLSQTYDGSPKPVSVTTNPPGLSHAVTYDGSASPPTNAGTYAVVATITEPNYAGNDSKNLIIAKASQTINFAALDPAYDNAAPFALTATASSGLPVSFNSSNPAVATVSGSTVTIVGLGNTTITASQAGNTNYNAASVPQTLNVVRSNPLAVAGGPYSVLVGQSLNLNGGASEPSYNETITAWEWDLNNDNTFGDVTGASTGVSYSTLVSTWGRVPGPNTIQLKVTDSAGKTSITSTTITLITTLTWDANGATANRTDGTGAWLDASKWWDGSQNVTWASGSNAIFGNGGAGGAVTLASPTTVNTITFNSFTGTYTLGTSGNIITLNGGITKNANSGTVAISSPVTFGGTQTWTNNSTNALTTGNGTNLITNGGYDLTVDGTGTTNFGVINNAAVTLSGTGALIKNGSGRLNAGGLNSGFSGAVTINGGVLQSYNDAGGLGNGNLTLNGGVLSFYWGVTYARTLGTGTGAVQIPGGESGLAGAGTTGPSVSLGTTVVWGALGQGSATGYFNPGKFVLGDAGTTNAAVTTFSSGIDLNGATRTIAVPKGLSAGGNNSTISGAISNSTGTAGLIKEGDGMLILSSSSSGWNGSTTISGGILDFAGNTLAGVGGGTGRNISVAAGAGVKFNALNNTLLSRIVETTDEIAVMTGTTSNNFDFSGGTGANLPNAFLGNWASNGAKAEISGTVTPASGNYLLGAKGSSGLLGIVGTNKLTGTQGLIVGGTGGSGIRVELAGDNNFTGDTVINASARLAIGNNLALQNSALNVGAAGGNISFSSGLLSGDILGNARSDSPTFGGLIGSRSLSTVFSNGASNNEQSLQSYQMLGFTLNTAAAASHTYSGVIANFARDTTITKTGSGTQELSGVNTFTGVTTINNGTLKIANASALGKGGSAGASNGSTIVNSGGTLDLNGITGVMEPIVLNGTGFGGNGALVNNSATAAGISGGLASLQVTSGGTYGVTAPTVTISGGGGTGATATATLGLTNATITSITSGGTGWVIGDQFTVAGGGGSGAVYQVTSINSGAITGWNIIHAGTGYTSTPTGITKLTGNSGGTNTFVFNNTNFTVSGLTLTNSGSGYSGTPAVSFNTGTATAAVQSSSLTLASDSSIGGSGNMTIGTVISESGGARALTKIGAGTLTLSGFNTYTGTTTVNGGILRITKPCLADASDIVIGSSGNLDLQFDESGGNVTDTVNALTIGGVPQPPGIYGATGSGATFINDARFAGLGTLTVLTGPDIIPPTLAGSAILDDKSGGLIAANTLVSYTVTFSEDMDAATVSAADFGNAGTAAITIGSVDETSPGIFAVQATPTSGGTLRLQINAAAVLKDVAGNNLNTASAILDDTTITVDGTVPTLASITNDKSGNPVTANTLVTYTVTFSEDMDAATVSAADFGNAGTAAITIGSVNETSSGIFAVEATPTTSGTLRLQINSNAVLKDVAGNNLNTASAILDDTTITVDGTVPTLASITDDKSSGPVAINTLVTYTVTFGEDMDAATVSAADFGNAGSSTFTIGAISETSPGVFTVEATPTTSGTLRLQINAAAVLKDVAGNDLNTTVAIPDDTTITVDGNAPTLASIADNKGGNPVIENTLVTYTVTFSEDMDAATVSAADFGNAGSSTFTIGAISETSPGVFTVEATPTTAGTLQLQINATAVLKDVAGNDLNTTVAIPDDTTITVDGTVPTLASITDDKSGNPVTENTLVTYTVTFSEDMDATTVSAADFGNAGSSSVTIGSISETSPGVFTVEATPTTAGTLQLQINAAAVLKDVAGNNLDTAAAIVDETVITVNIADPYAVWSGGAAFDADANDDGVKNGMAWMLGATNKDVNAQDKMPVASLNGGNLRLSFRCLKSTKRGGVLLKVQSSGDLGVSDPWTSHEASVPDADESVNGVDFDTTDDGDFIRVVADIPAAGANLYGRLMAQQP